MKRKLPPAQKEHSLFSKEGKVFFPGKWPRMDVMNQFCGPQPLCSLLSVNSKFRVLRRGISFCESHERPVGGEASPVGEPRMQQVSLSALPGSPREGIPETGWR